MMYYTIQCPFVWEGKPCGQDVTIYTVPSSDPDRNSERIIDLEGKCHHVWVANAELDIPNGETGKYEQRYLEALADANRLKID